MEGSSPRLMAFTHGELEQLDVAVMPRRDVPATHGCEAEAEIAAATAERLTSLTESVPVHDDVAAPPQDGPTSRLVTHRTRGGA
jgi:hypothetical protein